MKLSAVQRKWSKRILIFLGFWLIILFGLSQIIDYRFKDIIRLAVKEKSSDTYAFDAKDVDVSIFKRTIAINSAVFYHTDTLNATAHYDIKIPKIYLSIASFSDIIFHQKVSVTNLEIKSPSIYLHVHKTDNAPKKAFHPGNIEALMNKLLQHLEVKTFKIRNASYLYRSKDHPKDLKINQINFTVSNFSNVERKSLFASEDVDLTINKQHISFPDGLHSIDFKKLHFSGKNHYFQLDSSTFTAKATSDRAETKVIADKIRFKSAELSSIFSKDDLIIDTVILIKPVLQIGKSKSVSSKSVENSKIKHLFKWINFKYVSIQDGSFLNIDSIGNAGNETKKVDLKIYNLSYHPSISTSLKTDSVKLNLNKIKFLSKDGKSQLTVEELAIANNKVVFRNAVYAPIHANGNSSLSFTTPSLQLKNVNLNALLNKKISADEAVLMYPVITVITKPKIVQATDTVADFSRFFKIMHNIKGLIGVQKFNIVDGTLHLKSHSKFGTDVHIDKLNSNILVDKLLNSDTTLEVKHAIPRLSFKRMVVKSPKLDLKLNDYMFNGSVRHNSASSVILNLSTGTSIKAKNLYWEWLDWDLYQSYKMIFVDSLRIGALDISINKASPQTQVKKPLPKLHIGRLDLLDFKFDKISNKNRIHLEGKNIFGRNIDSKNNELIWADLGGDFNNLKIQNEKISVEASHANLNAKRQNKIENVNIKIQSDHKIDRINLPLLEFKGPFVSTNFKRLKLEYFRLNEPDVLSKSVGLEPAVSSKKPFAIPIDFLIEDFGVKNGKLSFRKINQNDSTTISSTFNLNFINLIGKKNSSELLSIKSSQIDINQLDFNKHGINLTAPLFVKLENTKVEQKNKLQFFSEVELNANAIKFNYIKDSTRLMVKNASVNVSDKHFVFEAGQPFEWQNLIYKSILGVTDFAYRNKNATIKMNTLDWLPIPKKLAVNNFIFTPNLSWAESKRVQPWQTDYISGSAKKIEINGLNYLKLNKQFGLSITNVNIDGAELIASRDKRMAEKPQKEKLMPSKLMANVKMPIKIDRINVLNSHVDVHEISIATGREGVIPLGNLNLHILKLSNGFSVTDSLIVKGNASLMNQNTVNLNYRESYLDSLSGFKMNLQIAPIALASLSQISIPLASVKINSGNTENLVTEWTGNKYLAEGQILLPYKNLKISLLDKKNSERKTFLLFLENKLINLIVRHDNSKPAFVFFERNRQKFVFNYWIKTVLAGFASSAGLKKERRLRKQDLAVKTKNGLMIK
ncbi:hypothetical protein ACFOG5_11705 [Pedobacter fastidiosus]|uniref:hypothetical protein n=1 Tax=Pedobacter fastidiosus TaxID=2765361 RepID=UPI00164E8D11|nr:hypothetical protein [Pedobacter fastidiosus]